MVMPPLLALAARTRGALVCRRRRPALPRRCLSSASASPDPPGSGDDALLPDASPVATSLALSVHFRHPDLGMNDYEILSRATAFLLQVDPPEPPSEEEELQMPLPAEEEATAASHDAKGRVRKPAFPHLRENREIRNKLLRRQDYRYDPAGGPPRHAHQLNWLEFLPTAFRPKVHVVASSHVVSPWMWPQYYGQDWLKVVTQEHVRYSLEVWGAASSDGTSGGTDGEAIRHDGKLPGSYEPVAKFALSPYPIHHPKEMDVAVIHLKDEDNALKHITDLGVRPLHLPTMHELETSTDPVFTPGERVLFQGFEVYEANTTDQETLSRDEAKKSDPVDDERLFHPYSSLGTLTLASPDRFLARTEGTLPEGLCGGPVLKVPNEKDENAPLTIRGVVEGIVPPNHDNPQLAGLASFLPSYRMREFVDFAERVMLEHIIEPELFQRVVDMKERRPKKGTTYATGRGDEVREVTDATQTLDDDDDDERPPDDPAVRVGMEGISEESDTPHIDREYRDIVASLREHHAPEEVDAILATVEREREEVVKIMEAEGGDMDDVIAAVRERTYEEKDRIMREIEREMTGQSNVEEEAEIVSSSEDDKSTP